MRIWQKNLIAASIVCLVIFLGYFISWIRFINSPMLVRDKAAIVFVFPKSASVHTLSEKLVQQGVLAKPGYFILLAYLDGATKSLQAGEYTVDPGITPLKLLAKIKRGKVVLHQFTIIPGWTFQRLLNELEKDPYLRHELKGLSDKEIMEKLGHSGEMPEGRFLPETYKFSLGTNDSKILQQAYDLMQRTLKLAWESRSVMASFRCSYDALIAASILEKEAASDEERAIISGIMLQRLRRNMFLQMDPTVIYGLGKSFKGKLTDRELQRDTPFNTYMHKNLPPTPICLPSKEAILAALHPIATGYLYFVAKGDGTHDFSSSLPEHNRAIKKYELSKTSKRNLHDKRKNKTKIHNS